MTLAHPFSGKWKKLLNTAIGGALLLTGCTAADSAPNSASAKAAATTNDNSDPALWVVKDHDTTIYMFGTVHLLKPGLSWFDEAVKDAFDKSDTLVMEIADVTDPEAMKAMEPLVKKYAADANGKKLRDKLTAEQRSIFDAEMAKLGMPATTFDAYDPWFVSTVLSMAHYGKAGMSPESGAEKVLAAAAKASGKKMESLETAEQQFGWFDATPESEQVTGLIEVITKGDEIASYIDRMSTAWNKGDADGLAAVLNENIDHTPETRRLLLTDRNARWAEWVEKRLKQPGTVFMAVGAGHLAGKDSVQDFLAKRNVKVKRIQY